MDIRKVKKLIELLEESGVSEIEVCEGEESVRISRQVHTQSTQTHVQVPDVGAALASGGTNPVAVELQSEPQPEPGHIITSPMVGIFYASPAPGEPPFVSVGQVVNKGDVVCVLEAMKIMNQIESDVTGTISRVHVSNGEAVEYGQPLFTITEVE
jgi:acetyl-CoA carboxylase biotin carboxyl carrier protein